MADIFDQLLSGEETPKGDIFDHLASDRPRQEKRGPLQETGRHLARSVSRAGEALFGLPGDILRTAQIGASGLEKTAGNIREQIGLSPRKTEIKKPGFPGSEELRDLSQNIFGEMVKPQSGTEEFLDDIVSDASLLAIPVKGKIPFKRAIGSAIAANFAGKGAKEFGLSEKGQTAAKLGTFFLAALTGKGNVKKYWKNQYQLAEDAIPQGARLDANKLNRQLDKLKASLRKGGIETPSQKFVEKPLDDLQRIIRNGEMRVEDVVAAKRKINELRSGLFDEVKGTKNQKFARTKINDISHYLDESLKKYGENNPQFLKHYIAGNEAYGGFYQSKKVGNWIARNLRFPGINKGTILILEALFKPSTLPASAAGFGLFKGAELATRFGKNPTLRRYYNGLIKSAINENRASFGRNARGLQKEMEKNPDIFEEILRSQNESNN